MAQFRRALDVDDQVDAHLLFGHEVPEVVVQYAVLELAQQTSVVGSIRGNCLISSVNSIGLFD